MTKKVIVNCTFAVLIFGFLFFLYGAAINSYKTGTGLSYLSELDRLGLQGQRVAPEVSRRVGESSKIVGYQYAAAMAFAYVGYFGALLVAVGYAFDLPLLSTKRTFSAGVLVLGLAALAAGSSQLFMGKYGTTGEGAFGAGIVMWVLTSFLFTVLVTTIWGVRKIFRSRRNGVES